MADVVDLDELDRSILQVLVEDARTSTAEVARRVGAARATVHHRIQRLEEQGVIEGATLMLDHGRLGKPLHAFIRTAWVAESEADQRAVARRIAEVPGVVRVHIVTGGRDFLVEVRAEDMEDVGTTIIDELRGISGVGDTETTMVFWSYDGTVPGLEG